MFVKELKYLIKNWILPPGFIRLIKKTAVEKEVADFSGSVNHLVEKSNIVKDRHIGKRCFILGAGSSVKQQDMKKLADEYVISVSNTYVHPDYHLFKPQYHVLPHILFGHSGIYSEEKFVTWFKDMDKKIFDAEIFLHIGDKRLIYENNIFKNRKIHWVEYCKWTEDFDTQIDLGRIPHIWSVSELAITIAVFMGFEKIYLLGFDHDWFNGPLVYFYDHQKENKVQPSKEKLSFADSEHQMRRHAYIFKKYKYLYSMRKNIFNANANPDTYVDVFPKINFDSLF